jgi:hypothetical protein
MYIHTHTVQVKTFGGTRVINETLFRAFAAGVLEPKNAEYQNRVEALFPESQIRDMMGKHHVYDAYSCADYLRFRCATCSYFFLFWLPVLNVSHCCAL